jgi:hypothetical protein
MRQRTLTLVAVTLFCLSGLSLAQRKTTDSSNPTAEITIQGCVIGGTRYTFLQPSTGAMFALSGDSARFSPVQGKVVEVTANEFAPKPNSNELPRLRVNQMHVVGDKCPVEPRAARPSASSPVIRQGTAPTSRPATGPYADPGTANQGPPNVNNPNISGDTGKPGSGTGNPPQPQ